eukprot:g1212.t1
MEMEVEVTEELENAENSSAPASPCTPRRVKQRRQSFCQPREDPVGELSDWSDCHTLSAPSSWSPASARSARARHAAGEAAEETFDLRALAQREDEAWMGQEWS